MDLDRQDDRKRGSIKRYDNFNPFGFEQATTGCVLKAARMALKK